MKLCKHCRHARHNNGRWMCNHPDAPHSFVTGDPTSECERERAVSCGHSAKRYEVILTPAQAVVELKNMRCA
jgi:hypothetical protein